MMGGLNALQIILASGFSGVTDLGHVPESVLALASLPERVTLIRANESVTFKLSAKRGDPVRSDTSVYRWLVEMSKTIVELPDYFIAGSDPCTFQLLKRVPPPSKHHDITFLRLPIKFVSSAKAASRAPELWVRTAIMHTEETVAVYLKRGVRIGA